MKLLWTQQSRPFADVGLQSDQPGRDWWAGLADLTESAHVGRVRHVLLEPRSGVGFTATGRRVTDVVQSADRLASRSRWGWLRGARRATRVRQPALSLREPGRESNWYHLLLDILGGRLRLADEVLGPDLALVVSADLPSQGRELLVRGGLAGRELVIHERGRWLHVDDLAVVKPPRHDAAAVTYLWELLAVPRADPTTDDRLLITRESGTGRSFSNEDEVMALARRYDLNVVTPWALKLDEQIELFSRASLVVGAHGAGLTGILWRREAPLTVIDVQVDGRAAPMRPFAYLTASLGGRYVALGNGLWRGSTRDPKGDQRPKWKQDALHVDCVALAHTIEAALSGDGLE